MKPPYQPISQDEARRLRVLVEAYRAEFTAAADALGFQLEHPISGRLFLAEEITLLRDRIARLESASPSNGTEQEDT